MILFESQNLNKLSHECVDLKTDHSNYMEFASGNALKVFVFTEYC